MSPGGDRRVAKRSKNVPIVMDLDMLFSNLCIEHSFGNLPPHVMLKMVEMHLGVKEMRVDEITKKVARMRRISKPWLFTTEVLVRKLHAPVYLTYRAGEEDKKGRVRGGPASLISQFRHMLSLLPSVRTLVQLECRLVYVIEYDLIDLLIEKKVKVKTLRLPLMDMIVGLNRFLPELERLLTYCERTGCNIQIVGRLRLGEGVNVVKRRLLKAASTIEEIRFEEDCPNDAVNDLFVVLADRGDAAPAIDAWQSCPFDVDWPVDLMASYFRRFLPKRIDFEYSNNMASFCHFLSALDVPGSVDEIVLPSFVIIERTLGLDHEHPLAEHPEVIDAKQMFRLALRLGKRVVCHSNPFEADFYEHVGSVLMEEEVQMLSGRLDVREDLPQLNPEAINWSEVKDKRQVLRMVKWADRVKVGDPALFDECKQCLEEYGICVKIIEI